MAAFLQLIADGKLNLPALITHRFPMEEATRAYDLITGMTREFFLGVMIKYPEIELANASISPEKIAIPTAPVSTGALGLCVLGAGNFAQNTLLPALKEIPGVSFVGVCNATGPRSRNAAEKFGFSYCTNSELELLRDPKISAVVIATRHSLHASQTLAALRAGKAVFCEKPLCLNERELSELVSVSAHESGPLLVVGFNRRFAPMAGQMKRFVDEIHEPIAMHYRVNAGFIPADHWVNDEEQGGGGSSVRCAISLTFCAFLLARAQSKCRRRVWATLDNTVRTT